MSKFKVALIQMSMSLDMDANTDKAIQKTIEAAEQGAKIVCLPEMYRSQYFCQREDISLFDLAEPSPASISDCFSGDTYQLFEPLARQLGITVLAPIFEARAPGLYHNSVLVFGPNGYMGIYRKTHIPDDPNYYEKFYFTPGDLGYKVFNTPQGRVGSLICWDQWYPEAARLTALQGALAIFYPTAIGWLPADKQQYGEAQRDAWKTIQRSHAIANGVYVAVANRVGHEIFNPGTPGLEFWGTSFVCDPGGTIIAEASTDKEETLIAEIDTAQVEFIRREWPFLRDRRIDTYSQITSRHLS